MITARIKAINSLRPKSKWVMLDEVLEWTDDEQTQPTEDEIQAEIARMEAEFIAKEYQRERAAKYPPIADYMDGIVKGDQAQVQAYIDACLAVKAKYPKG
jgi:hypothetical protein